MMFRCRECGAINRVNKDAGGNKSPICGKCKTSLDTSGSPQDVDGRGLARAIANSTIPVLVDVWAPWCGPCRMVAPTVEKIARANKGRVLVLKLNSDENPEPSTKYRISGIPTFMVFKDGKVVERKSGALPEPALQAMVQKHLA